MQMSTSSVALEGNFYLPIEKYEHRQQHHSVCVPHPPSPAAITWYAISPRSELLPRLQNKYESDGDVNGDGEGEIVEEGEEECDEAEEAEKSLQYVTRMAIKKWELVWSVEAWDTRFALVSLWKWV